MSGVRIPAGAVLEPADAQRAFFDVVGAWAGEVVPVVGAGLAGAAGVPSVAVLQQRLLEAAGAAWAASRPDAAGWGLFAVADALEHDFSERWVQETAAAVVSAVAPVPTPALLALSRVRSGLVLTTNYDLAIETAAREAGVSVTTLTLEDFGAALSDPDGVLRVMHLHGLADRPETVVLGSRSYKRVREDERMRLLVRAVSTRRRLLFLGHRLAVEEEHLRRDVLWVTRTADGGEPRHLLLADERDWTSAATQARAEEMRDRAGVRLVVFPDPQGQHEAAVRAAHVVAGRSAVASADQAPQLRPEADRLYLPVPVARGLDATDPGRRGAWMARVWQHGPAFADSLDATGRLLLVGGGGFGKSEELRQIGRRSTRPALLQTLTSLQPEAWAGPDADPGPAFVRSMAGAATPQQEGAPRLTYERLAQGSYVFLLDGLDEVLADRRSDVASFVAALAQRYPQHRWVLATRPVPGLTVLEDLFEAWTPVPDRAWLVEYARLRGVPQARLALLLGDAPGVADLIEIPVYAAAVVDCAEHGRELPRTALGLVLRLADERTLGDPRLGHDRQVGTWLDRLALYLKLGGRTEIAVEELAGTQLHDELDQVAPTPKLLRDLAVRALLTDHGGTVRFPANIVLEARAARALLDSGDAGLSVLTDRLIVRLPIGDGRVARSLRPSWAGTLELALPNAPPGWRNVVAAADPLLAARAVPPDAAPSEGHAAARTIWSAYTDRRVWLDDGFSSKRDDAGALVRLLRRDRPPDLVAMLTAATRADEPTQRANALTVLRGIGHPDTQAVAARLVTDPHPVVRRRAASVALALQAVELADAIARQATVDEDDMASRTLTDVAVSLAADDEHAIRFAYTLPARTADHAVDALAGRLPRDRILRLLAEHTPLDVRLLAAVLPDGHRHGQTPWTAADAVRLGRIAAANHDQTLGLDGLDTVLHAHAEAVAVARAADPPGDDFDFDMENLLAELSDARLDELHAVLASSPADIAASGVAPGGGTPRPDSLERLRAAADRIDGARHSPPRALPVRPARPAPPRRPSPQDAAAASDWPALLSFSHHRALPALNDPPPPGLLRQAAADLDRLLAGTPDGLSAPDHQPRDPAGRTLNWAAALNLDVPPQACAVLAEAAIHRGDPQLKKWVHDRWHPDAWPDLARRLPRLGARRLALHADVVPAPWPAGLTTVVLDAALLPTLDDHERAHAAEQARLHADDQAVLSWAPSPPPDWLLPVLAAAGHPDAERRLLQALGARPGSAGRLSAYGDTAWLGHVRHPETAPALVDTARALMATPTDGDDLSALFDALDRCAGPAALDAYDLLITDPALPHGRWLLYQRQRSEAQFAEATALAALPPDRELQQQVVARFAAATAAVRLSQPAPAPSASVATSPPAGPSTSTQRTSTSSARPSSTRERP